MSAASQMSRGDFICCLPCTRTAQSYEEPKRTPLTYAGSMMPPVAPLFVQSERVEWVGWRQWALQLERDGNRWRCAWVVDDRPDLPCGCGADGPPYHLHHCHQVRHPGGGWGWHRSEAAAVQCAERVLRYWRWWFEENRWWREVERPRRARERLAGDRLRKRVLAEEPTCRFCGAASEEVDHIVPIYLGGSSERPNLRGLCRPCHADLTAALNLNPPRR